jgi:hypothetical protein
VVTTVGAAVVTAEVVTAAVDTEEVAVDITEVEEGLLTTLAITQATVAKVIKATKDIMTTKRDRRCIMTKEVTVVITVITEATRRDTTT